MSKQLAISAAVSTFALAAMALLAPGSAPVRDLPARMGATIAIAAPLSLAEATTPIVAELLPPISGSALN